VGTGRKALKRGASVDHARVPETSKLKEPYTLRIVSSTFGNMQEFTTCFCRPKNSPRACFDSTNFTTKDQNRFLSCKGTIPRPLRALSVPQQRSIHAPRTSADRVPVAAPTARCSADGRRQARSGPGATQILVRLQFIRYSYGVVMTLRAFREASRTTLSDRTIMSSTASQAAWTCPTSKSLIQMFVS